MAGARHPPTGRAASLQPPPGSTDESTRLSPRAAASRGSRHHELVAIAATFIPTLQTAEVLTGLLIPRPIRRLMGERRLPKPAQLRHLTARQGFRPPLCLLFPMFLDNEAWAE